MFPSDADLVHRAVHAPFRSVPTLSVQSDWPEEAQAPTAGPWCFMHLPPPVLFRVQIVGVAAGAVLGQWLGLGIQRAEVTSGVQGPQWHLSYGSGDAQHAAVMLLGAARSLGPAAEEQGYTDPELWCCLSQFVALPHKLGVEDLTARGFRVDYVWALHDARRLCTQPGVAASITAATEVLCTQGQLTGSQASTLLRRHHAPDRLTPVVWTPPPGEDASSDNLHARPHDSIGDVLRRAPIRPELEGLYSELYRLNDDMRDLAARFRSLDEGTDGKQ